MGSTTTTDADLVVDTDRGYFVYGVVAEAPGRVPDGPDRGPAEIGRAHV